jgi:hypothetical protein
MSCAEIVTFRTKDGVADADYLADAAKLDAYLKSCPGFITRRLSKNEDGLWTDYLEWASKEAAIKAGEGFMSQPAGLAMMELSVEDSFTMRHEPILLAA